MSSVGLRCGGKRHILQRCTVSCTRRQNTWHHVVDLSCFSDVHDVSSCRSETPSLIEEFRGRVSKIDVDFRDVKGVWF